MLPQALFLLLAFCCVLTGCAGDEACTQTREGCKIEEGRCICGLGCYTEFRYNSRAECQKAVRGIRRDICQSKPCRHNGICSQIAPDPGFKCRCEGTGFHGQRCHKPCPKFTSRMTGEYPFECIVI